MKTVIRLVTEDEVMLFNSIGLLNGKIKDTYYMHVKTVGINQNIHGSDRYIKEIEALKAEAQTKEIEDGEKNNSYHSESLFE